MADQTEKSPVFMGRGNAILNITGFENWKDFFTRDEQPLSDADIDTIEQAATYENYCVEGKVRVEWPEVILDFNMDRFFGIRRSKRSTEKPMILSASQNFAKIIHPFAIDKEWFKGLNSKDVKRFEGFEWVFEQNKDDFLYKGHVRRGREMLVTFDFGPDRRYHDYQGQ